VKYHAWMTVGALVLSSCETVHKSIEPLAVVRLAPDRELYVLRRVGILPIVARDMRREDALALQSALAIRLSERIHAEVIVLTQGEAAEIPTNDAYLSGRIDPGSVLAFARRFNLDGLVTSNVTDRRTYAPQRLGLEVELTACDSGLPIWSASVRLDAAQERTRESLCAWFERERGAVGTNETADLYLLSPQRFAEFAAAQVAMGY
jgi:hypothetical protein